MFHLNWTAPAWKKKISIEKRKKKEKRSLLTAIQKRIKIKISVAHWHGVFKLGRKKKSKLYTAKCLKFFLSFCGMFFLFVFILFYFSRLPLTLKENLWHHSGRGGVSLETTLRPWRTRRTKMMVQINLINKWQSGHIGQNVLFNPFTGV